MVQAATEFFFREVTIGVWIDDIKLKKIRPHGLTGRMRRYISYIFMLTWALTTLLAAPTVAHAAISGVDVEVAANGVERLKFNANTPISIRKSFVLNNPDRIVVDIPQTEASAIALPKNYKGKLLKSIRFGRFDATTSRIVLDLKMPARLLTSEIDEAFTLEIVSVADAKAGLAPLDAKPLVIIDAGHGGQDPGALGLHGTHEKDITLNFARSLREALLRTGRYRVALTREDDRFITLQERVAIARKLKGDIFISFHADSNPRPEARGFSVYTLSETASDDEAAALAESENKADIIQGINLNTTDADVASILIDLTQRETMNKSSRLADILVDSLHYKIMTLQKTHRFAGFRVLKAPDIPSVLIELGFLSNEADERLLLSPEYRDLMVASIVKGIDRFRAGE
jgi:N-acetylmuramoyl-L-alanine amidase